MTSLRNPSPPLWLLVLATFSGTLAMHMFVPALPLVARELRATPAAAQSTISLYILGLAFGQLLYGPLSDRFGRRPTLLAGLALYTAAGLVCLWAPTVQVLLGARLLQALGGCAGLLLARAIVRDTCGPTETLQRLAALGLITLVGPGIAPLLGAAVADTLGWRWVCACFVLLGVLALAAVWVRLPETRPALLEPAHRSSLLADARTLLRSRLFVACTLGGGCSTTAFYAFVAAAPFIFGERLHRPLHEVGYYLMAPVIGMSIGNLLAARLAGRVQQARLMRRASALSLASATLLLLAMSWMAQPSAWGVAVLMGFHAMGAGLCSPAVSTKALSVDPRLTGSAAGLYGFTQMAIGALCSALAGWGSDPGISAALVLVGAGVVAQAVFRWGVPVES
ncbi:multidrug effflux MFS transporter [Azohydromonas caseinilytica]|uniref:Bcr/CflA family efflux transporter n=1 Tax=Azohydromonas caseinilytica TaxID=2728836 RepID=A0A848FIY6_9BURK|nr:multidrug effflux MFS transporter [Azohydromonas caseinilytica]NML18160.1 multidrug effflux MFS transporter [Azohydromonas caseinilytica]